MLKGKRTYITAILGAVYAALIGLELLPNLEWVWGLLGAGGLAFLRAGLNDAHVTNTGLYISSSSDSFTFPLAPPKPRTEAGPTRPPSHPPVKKLLMLLLLPSTCLLFMGCASVNQSVRTELQQTNGVVEIRETRNRILAVWDAKQTVEKTKLSNGKTQSIGTSGVESEATNMTTNLRALADLLNALR